MPDDRAERAMERGEELANLKRFLRILNGEEPSCRVFIQDGAGNDVTEREVDLLEKEIRYLETVIERRSKPMNRRGPSEEDSAGDQAGSSFFERLVSKWRL
jgi:hypothetical protein